MLIRWFINSLIILALPYLIPGVSVRSFWTALLTALILGILNALVRPILVILTLPITIVTLGLFLIVLNALLVWFASTIIKGFEVTGFLPALEAAIIIWFAGLLTNGLIRGRKKPSTTARIVG
jgi:putative membrane protein